MSDTVSQMIYAWQGADDVSVLDSSSRPAVSESDIRKRVRMQDGTSGLRRPEASLCYMHYANAAVVVRRARGTGDDRQDFSHVLVGTRRLTALAALALQDWPGWLTTRPQPGGDRLVNLDEGQLVLHESAPPPVPVGDDRALIERVVAQVLRDLVTRKTHRVVVVDGLAAERGPRVMPAIVDQVHWFLEGLPDEQQQYGFSTWETTYVGKTALAGGQIIFAPEVHREDRYASSWSTVISANQASEPDVWDRVAARWMDLYVSTGNRDAVGVWLQDNGLLTEPDLDARLAGTAALIDPAVKLSTSVEIIATAAATIPPRLTGQAPVDAGQVIWPHDGDFSWLERETVALLTDVRLGSEDPGALTDWVNLYRGFGQRLEDGRFNESPAARAAVRRGIVGSFSGSRPWAEVAGHLLSPVFIEGRDRRRFDDAVRRLVACAFTPDFRAIDVDASAVAMVARHSMPPLVTTAVIKKATQAETPVLQFADAVLAREESETGRVPRVDGRTTTSWWLTKFPWLGTRTAAFFAGLAATTAWSTLLILVVSGGSR